MNEIKLENKIRKSTKDKDYDKSKDILLSCYLNQFKKMIKYKKVKIDKTWFLYDYLIQIKKLYSSYYDTDIDKLIDILYSDKYSIKYQISWLLDNSYMFNDYKL